ncbi:probable indole-3-pyruvate monooxygenase YUCCA4 [Physcomitrium patens]|uniref:indole-3-pyruvate monooxygenase n=1 Tax=Physcomitrium patens TaxID=3218 RepID=A0A2K1KV43_PHYPA|nr:probable indole-3-pyruvate monooxygenase YUCCA4 [Physcomitrium patens]PNR57631.1 hypothetical protein PHYPA_004625 [Physcomitrium patens]|eukprot:XP_024369268.1 probable indole-3-pyruvate monooxygenase YUCCA4 [Physcomitrella patens]
MYPRKDSWKSGDLPVCPSVQLGSIAGESLRNRSISSKVNSKEAPQTVLIIGAGPAGLATAACLRSKYWIPSIILERANCSAPLWRYMTYDRLRMHLPKQFCQLPLRPFPAVYPKYPTKNQFIAYLEDYQRHFGISPVYNATVTSAEFSTALGLWVVIAEQKLEDNCETVTYTTRSLVVATGENAEPYMPDLFGSHKFHGVISHGSTYRNGVKYKDMKVLVVGAGNTGMEISLDLAKFGAKPTLVARSKFHVMPRDLFGLNISAFQVMLMLLKVLPVSFVDKLLVIFSRLTLGDTDHLNLVRPKEGPLKMKARTGHTPVLDVGTVAEVRNGFIKVAPAIDQLTKSGARFVNGVEEEFDAVIMATGYTSNVYEWLKIDGMSGINGFPKRPFRNGWKGGRGLYAVGFGRKGLMGCAHDAELVADDIGAHHRDNEKTY